MRLLKIDRKYPEFAKLRQELFEKQDEIAFFSNQNISPLIHEEYYIRQSLAEMIWSEYMEASRRVEEILREKEKYTKELARMRMDCSNIRVKIEGEKEKMTKREKKYVEKCGF